MSENQRHARFRGPAGLFVPCLLALGCGSGGDGSAHSGDTEAPTGEPTGGGSSGTSDGGVPACEFAGDGVCDEPGNCELGSDEADCVAACASAENLHRFAAACAFRDPAPPPDAGGRPSGGTLHLTGHRDGVIEVSDGESAGTVQRHYRLYVPPNYDPERPMPLLIVMPGHRVPHYGLGTYTEIAQAADHNGFIVAYLEQQWRNKGERRWAWWTDWAWSANANGNPDIEFIAKVVNRLGGEYNLDLDRIYTSGHSRGAAMAFIAALELSDYIAGALVESGFTESGYLDARLSTWSGRKVPMVFMHGIDDPDVPVGAGDALVGRLRDLGWQDDEDLVYYRLGNVAHRWQPWLNQPAWDFLAARPLDGTVTPTAPSPTVAEAAAFDAGELVADKVATAPVLDLDDMVAVGPTTFTMGNELVYPAAYGDAWFLAETPAHPVTLDAYWIDRTEVTVAAFAEFLTHAAGEYHFDPDQPIERVDGGFLPMAGHEDEPIRRVTWEAAAQHCQWAGKRLPTEAEWERAAAGEEGRRWPWGEAGPGCGHASFFPGGSYCDDSVTAVGSHPAGDTPDGLHDMGGNVAEWVADYFSMYPASGDPETNPTGPADGTMRTIRGGSFLDGSLALQSRNRRGAAPGASSDSVGFRCAANADPPDAALRGAIAGAADEGREPTDRPLAPPATRPDVLASGLASPAGVALLGDQVYALDQGTGSLLRLDGPDAFTPVLEGLVEATGVASDGQDLFVTDAGTGAVHRIPEGQDPGVIATDEIAPRLIVADTAGVYWTTDSGLTGWSPEQGATPMLTLAGSKAIGLSAGHVYVSTDGGATPSEAQIVRVARNDSTVETVLSNQTFGTDFYPAAVSFDAGSDRLYLLYRRRPAPGASLCFIPGGLGAMTCVTHSPLPDPGWGLVTDGSRVYWSSQQTLVTMDVDLDTTFTELGDWTRPRGMALAPDRVVWGDVHDGRVYEVAR